MFGRIFSSLTVIRPYLIVAPDFGKHPFYGGNPESTDGGNVKRACIDRRRRAGAWSSLDNVTGVALHCDLEEKRGLIKSGGLKRWLLEKK